jgi:hypothetical protein
MLKDARRFDHKQTMYQRRDLLRRDRNASAVPNSSSLLPREKGIEGRGPIPHPSTTEELARKPTGTKVPATSFMQANRMPLKQGERAKPQLPATLRL